MGQRPKHAASFRFRNRKKVVTRSPEIVADCESGLEAMPLDSQTSLKTYSPPKLNKLTPEQAKLLLIGHATIGDGGAKDLLEVLYPESPHDNSSVPQRCEKRGSVQIPFSKRPRLVRRVWDAFHSIGENFDRFVRG